MRSPIRAFIQNSLLFLALITLTILFDYFLHLVDLLWIGRYLGIIGTVLIITSLFYSIKKRKKNKSGGLKGYLQYHEYASWIGTLMILVHAGIHMNALLPWLAVMAMLITVASGLTGKYLQVKSIASLKEKRIELTQSGMTVEEINKELFVDSLTVDIIKKWRKVHYPITLVFGMLAITHIIIVLMYMARF